MPVAMIAIMREPEDGFCIAEEDLRLRGEAIRLLRGG
jgi:RecG-like helicase